MCEDKPDNQSEGRDDDPDFQSQGASTLKGRTTERLRRVQNYACETMFIWTYHTSMADFSTSGTVAISVLQGP